LLEATIMTQRPVTLTLLLALAASAAAARINQDLPQHFTAFAVSIGGPRTSSVATQVEITISRWSTSAQMERLISTLKTKGAESLLEELRDQPSVGTIRTPGNLAYDLRFAHQEPGEDGGRRIFLATDRPISFWEAVNRPRSFDYPFTFIELRMNGDGGGEGKLALATRIGVSSDGRTIELENYATQPIQLNDVRIASRDFD
jgi:hypothetical protein